MSKHRILTLCILCCILESLVGAAFPADKAYERCWKAYTRQNYATALCEWRPLAQQGNVQAQFRLGYMYANGEGVVKDEAEAVSWYKQAAAQGQPYALSNLSRLGPSTRAAIGGGSISGTVRCESDNPVTENNYGRAHSF